MSDRHTGTEGETWRDRETMRQAEKETVGDTQSENEKKTNGCVCLVQQSGPEITLVWCHVMSVM